MTVATMFGLVNAGKLKALAVTAKGREAVLAQSPEEFAAFARSEHARWAMIIRESGLAAK